MRFLMLALIAGILSLRLLPKLPSPLWLTMALCIALIFIVRRSFAVTVFILAFCWACIKAQWALDDQLALALDVRTLWLEGRVVGLPEWPVVQGQPSTVRFEMADVTARRAQLPQRIRLSWRDPPESVRAGERWRLAVRLKRPDGLLNPNGFDYQAWLFAKRIGATGSVKAGQRLSSGKGLDHWREGLRKRLQDVAPKPMQGVMIALLLGDGSGLSDQQWQVLQTTGTVHLLVISGQHISLMAGMAYACVVFLLRFGWWPVRVPWLPVACLLSILAALLYGTLAGFAVPVQRACVMVSIALLWRWQFQHLSAWTAYLVALSAVLLYEPLVVLQAGFWLSFAAVAALVLAFSGRLGAWRWWQVLGRAQWVAAVGLAPFLLGLGLPFSLLGPLANLLAIPWLSVLALPVTLFGAAMLAWPSVAAPLLGLAGWLLQQMFDVLEWLAQSEAVWINGGVSIWALFFALLGVVCALLPRPLIPVLALLGLCMPLLRPAEMVIEQGQAEVWLLDVGQGQAVWIKTEQHSMLYDAGPFMAGFDAGERVVVPFLQGFAQKDLDLLLISHADADHAGGAQAVIDALQVKRVVSGQPSEHPTSFAAQACTETQWQWDGVWFWRWQWDHGQDSNQKSCVLLLSAQGERLLLTGDLDAAGEAALLAAWPWLKTDWLVAGHHGSRSSSSRRFLRAITPRRVLISRGKHNSYGHPHPMVLADLKRENIGVYDTAQDKALQIRLGSYQTLWTMALQSRFWRAK